MDKRKIKSSKNGITRLLSTGISSSQISVRSNSTASTSSANATNKRVKSPSPGNEIDDNLSLGERNPRKRCNISEQENLTQERGETSRAPSRMSDWGSQTSSKSRESNMSKLLKMCKRNENPEKALFSISKPEKNNPRHLKSQNIQESNVHSQTRSVIEPSKQKSVLPMNDSDEEDDQFINGNQSLIQRESPERRQKFVNSRLQSPTNKLFKLSTPLKEKGSESDESLFSSGSPSAKKRGSPKHLLRSPGDKDKYTNGNSPRSNVSRRILGNKNSSPIRGSILSSVREANISKERIPSSPIRSLRSEVQLQSPRRPIAIDNSFLYFLNAAGVTLMNGQDPHEINADPNVIKDKMKKLLQAKDNKHKKDEIIEEWNKYIEIDANFKKAATNLQVVNDGAPFPSWYSTSLIKLLVQVSEIQKPILESILQRLNEVILEAVDPQSVSWTSLHLQQLRFLETIVDPESMTLYVENILETTPVWFQRELIVFLPDIVVDCQHHATAEMLVKLIELRPELINAILECIANLSIGKSYYEELRVKVINMLEAVDTTCVPAIVGFVLKNCDEERPAEKLLQMLRCVHIEPLPGTKIEDSFTIQMSTVKIIQSSMKASKKVIQALMSVIKKPDENGAKPIDLIVALLLFSIGTSTKKSVEAIFKQHLRSGYYRTSLLQVFYKDFLEVAKHLQPIALTLASNLVCLDDRLYADFAIEWFIAMIVSQSQKVFRQREVIERILSHVGYNNVTAKNCFMIFSRMIAHDEKREYLQAHCKHLSILLEKVDNLDLESVAILNDVLHGLCIKSSSNSESLQSDLSILMQKQLSSPKPLTKCKGVLGAVMAIKHSASNGQTCEKAKEIFDTVIAGVEHCPRSRALFYDRMSQVIYDAKQLDESFLQIITTHFENVLMSDYLVETSKCSDDMEAKFGLNSRVEDPSDCVIKFEEGKFGGIVPALFRIIRMCSLRLSKDNSLDDINVLLGCPILLPKDLDSPEPKNLDYMLYCINWFREVISGFINQSDSLMQRQVLKRLDMLMHMQGEFQILLSMCDARYSPPLAYFHNFPAKPFVKVEKKSTKKGKKGAAEKSHTGIIPEWETFDLGSLLSSKNPSYFRQLDAKVAHLLDVQMDMTLTQTSRQAVTIAQVCFLIKELLGMLENDNSETLVHDLIYLLPQICNKLQNIVKDLRENEIDDCEKREAVVLLLRLINQIFSWKELFHSAKYKTLLRDGLRTLAAQINESNASLSSCKELASESYKYFHSLSDVAQSRSIILANAIVNVCGTLMKHSRAFTDEVKGKHATMAYDFLRSQDWLDKPSGAAYRNAVAGLLKTWLENEPSPLEKISEIMIWLEDDVKLLDKPHDFLKNLPSINKVNFPLLFKKVLEGLVKGTKHSLSNSSNSDTRKLEIWKDVAQMVKEVVIISRMIGMKTIFLVSVRNLILLMRIFLSQGLPILEYNLKYHMNDVTEILKLFQGVTRYLHNIYCTGIQKKDTAMAKSFPAIKSIVEEFVCKVKAMMVLNNIVDAFWMGNLKNKNLQGDPILSQTSTEESLGGRASTSDGTESHLSEILPTDLDESMLDEAAEEENADEDNLEEAEDDLEIDSI